MKKISTGEPSTLKTYRKIAMFINANDTSSTGVKFIDNKIKESKNGENEEVVADETQMLFLLGQMLKDDLKLEESNTSHELKGQAVTIKKGTYEGQTYVIEDYWHIIDGRSWYERKSNPACIKYTSRVAKDDLPFDDEVLYGKIGSFGELIHISEILEDIE